MKSKTHPFVNGMVTALFVNAVYEKHPQTPLDVIWYGGLILIPAAGVALMDWFSRVGIEKENTDVDL